MEVVLFPRRYPLGFGLRYLSLFSDLQSETSTFKDLREALGWCLMCKFDRIVKYVLSKIRKLLDIDTSKSTVLSIGFDQCGSQP
jgi:hypothetical protein